MWFFNLQRVLLRCCKSKSGIEANINEQKNFFAASRLHFSAFCAFKLFAFSSLPNEAATMKI